jgi:hypothetical protein
MNYMNQQKRGEIKNGHYTRSCRKQAENKLGDMFLLRAIMADELESVACLPQ